MGKRRAGSQIVNLTSDHKKSRIDLIYLSAEGVPHTVGKLSTTVITLIYTISQSEVCSQSYEAPKSHESQLGRFWDSHLGVPRQKVHLDVGLVDKHRVYYKGEGGGFP